MGQTKENAEYLKNVNAYLDLDIQDFDKFINAFKDHEPEGRVIFDSEKNSFSLGMCSWETDRVQEELHEIQSALRDVMSHVAEHGVIGESQLENLNNVSHDLRIQNIYSPDTDTNMKLGYVVPDSRIAWEEGCCPHCGETVTIHLFPDPIPILAYEAIINTLRLLTRSVALTRNPDSGQFRIA